MSERDSRERDILVASNEYAYVQDLTKGDIVLYVGPTKISLSNTERLVDLKNDRFVPVRGEDAGVSAFVAASSAQYILLENPPKDPAVRPTKGNNSAVELLVGRRVVVPGPASFPLWPGQKAKVIGGHELREDEYLVTRVYDQTVDPATGAAGPPIGTEAVVRGSQERFFVPRTGVEVVPAPGGGYVRKARRLRKGTGLHVRVARAFVAAEGDQVPAGSYAAGQDLFIVDREGWFFPTETLEIVGEVCAIPLAEREGLYTRDLETGRIQTVIGPQRYLPDPTRVEVVARPVSDDAAELYGLSEDAIAAAADGRALSIHVASGFAVLVTAKDRREVVRGPVTRILDFDEDLEVLELSTGKPKSQETTLRTCFLQTDGNKVTDVLRLKTRDHNEIEAVLAYRVSFVARGGAADTERWFAVKDYVGLLCDHAGSLVRAAVRNVSIEAFYENSTEILRSAILGEKREGEPRAGRHFEENGLWVFDVEVLDVKILDPDVKTIITGAQKNAIIADVTRRQELLRLDAARAKEQVDAAIYEAQIATLGRAVELEAARRAWALAKAEQVVAVESTAKLGHARADAEALALATEARLRAAEGDAELERRSLEARVAAFKEQMAAMHPELVATLRTLGHQKLAAELSRNVAPLAILGGESVADVVVRLLGSLPVGTAATVAEVLTNGNGHGG